MGTGKEREPQPGQLRDRGPDGSRRGSGAEGGGALRLAGGDPVGAVGGGGPIPPQYVGRAGARCITLYAKWHATTCPCPTSLNCGSDAGSVQTAGRPLSW